MRLRTKLLLSLLVISSAVTVATLLIVQRSLKSEVQQEISTDLRSSVNTFQSIQRERQATSIRIAELIAELPSLKALMTTDPATIQDASRDLWRLSGGDLLILADRRGRVAALHSASPVFRPPEAGDLLKHSLNESQAVHWWTAGNRLYEVFLQPIYEGKPSEETLNGILAIGYEIDERVAKVIGGLAGSQVAFRVGNSIAASTLTAVDESELLRELGPLQASVGNEREVDLASERFVATTVNLVPEGSQPVMLVVLKSFDSATRFMQDLDRLLVALGLAALLVSACAVFILTAAFTRPLQDLVTGVHALKRGDFNYPLEVHGADEVAEVTEAFAGMRDSLRESQQQLVHAERLATIGRMASSISHDLRHPLTAIMANAEYLGVRDLNASQRADLYEEIRTAVVQMNELIESLLELSRSREMLHCVEATLDQTVQQAVRSLRLRPEFRHVQIGIHNETRARAYFDPQKLSRAVYNLLLNACGAAASNNGNAQVDVAVSSGAGNIELRIIDNGPGVAEVVCDRLFQPFVSYGKANGTGLGLTIVKKIVEDHGGTVILETTGPGRTIFRVTLPSASRSKVSVPTSASA